jgi:pyruvate dehydrogenase E1 component beta subunit
VPDEDYQIPFGQSRVAREGKDVVLIAWSAAVELSLRAAELLSAEGIEAAVLDLRTLVPLDVDGLVRVASTSGKVVIVHEAPLSGGFGAEVAATLQQQAFNSLDAPIERVTAWDTPYPPGSLENNYLPSLARVVEAARRVVAY